MVYVAIGVVTIDGVTFKPGDSPDPSLNEKIEQLPDYRRFFVPTPTMPKPPSPFDPAP